MLSITSENIRKDASSLQVGDWRGSWSVTQQWGVTDDARRFLLVELCVCQCVSDNPRFRPASHFLRQKRWVTRVLIGCWIITVRLFHLIADATRTSCLLQARKSLGHSPPATSTSGQRTSSASCVTTLILLSWDCSFGHYWRISLTICKGAKDKTDRETPCTPITKMCVLNWTLNETDLG